PPGLPRVGAIGLDSAVFAFGLGLTTLIGVVVGVVPALHASRADLRVELQQSSRQTAGARQLTRRALALPEVALALLLLLTPRWLCGGRRVLVSTRPRSDAGATRTTQVAASGRRCGQQTTHRVFAQGLEAARQTPGVMAAAFTSQLPLSGDLDEYGVRFEYDDP